MTAHRIRALITDDEPAGRDSIRSLLARHPDVEVVGECSTGPETVRAVADLHPDLLFLDVQLPGRSGVEVLREIPDELKPVVIFVTAYDEYALRAFDLFAADYLLKPYSDARFHTAVARARQRLDQQSLGELRGALLALADRARATGVAEPSAGQAGAKRLERLTIRTAGGVSILRTDEIAWIEATGDYARVHAGGKSFLIRTTMGSLERRLAPESFVRIHRSTIVNVSFVRELRGSATTEYAVVLKDGTVRKISGRGREQLARALDVRL